MSEEKSIPNNNFRRCSLSNIFKCKNMGIIKVIFIITLLGIFLNVMSPIPMPLLKENYHRFKAKVFDSNLKKLDVNGLDHDIISSATEYELKNILNCNDSTLQRETLLYGDYWLLKNYIRARKSMNMGCDESITYAINGDLSLMINLPALVKRWLAPISFAVYTPGPDYDETMSSILYLLTCLPESSLIRDFVTFHIYLPQKEEPPFIALTEEEALNWPVICTKRFEYNHSLERKYKPWYPLSEGYNIARQAANTHFVITSDIKFYPSEGLVKNFLKMLTRNPEIIVNNKKPLVFALPVFELQQTSDLPQSKENIMHWFAMSKVNTFNESVCSNCYAVPHLKEWFMSESLASMEVLTVAKRYDKFASWRPVFIGDKKVPLLMEGIPQQTDISKRLQNYAMCLMGYDYMILYPAFLVYKSRPPTKKAKKIEKEKEKLKEKQRKILKMNYEVFYGENEQCIL